MNSKIIAVDFDGTLCENKWPEIGEANEDRVSFRCGDVYKMAGIRPNYYETWSLEADEFLAQSAAKCCGKKLDSLQDIARVIQEEIKEKEFNDQN